MAITLPEAMYSLRSFKAPTGHNMSYVEWENPGAQAENPTLILCVHGLTRNGSDFDYLAKHIVASNEKNGKKCIVANIDVLGRGNSEWVDPSLYSYATYVPLLAAFIEFWATEKNVQKIYYIGTSMGGIIGMMLFTSHKNIANRIEKMVINDIGAIVPKPGLVRLGKYVANDPRFASLQEAKEYIKEVYSHFGVLSEEQWDHMTKYSIKADGTALRMHYDPAIGKAFANTPANDIDLTSFWESITCPVLLLHGLQSDLLTGAEYSGVYLILNVDEIIAKMRTFGPALKSKLQVEHFDKCGHAPSLMTDDQMQCIQHYLFN